MLAQLPRWAKIALIILIVLILVLLFAFAFIRAALAKELQSMWSLSCSARSSTVHAASYMPGFIRYCRSNVEFYRATSGAWPDPVSKGTIAKSQHLFFSGDAYQKRISWTERTSINSWAQRTGTDSTKTSEMMGLTGALSVAYGLWRGRSVAQMTGGSSGNYFFQWFTAKDFWWGAYSFVRGWEAMGWRPTDPVLVYYFHGANSIKLLKFLPGIQVLVPQFTKEFDISDESVSEFIDQLTRNRIQMVVSYPNIMYRVCQKLYARGIRQLDHSPKCIDLSADFLFTCQYEFIRSFFPGTDIRMTYGTIEFGQIAQQVPGHMYTYRVYSDVAYVESIQGNLVVTAFNYSTLPMLRYMTDDKGIVIERDGTQYIENLVGKQNTSIDYLVVDAMLNKLNVELAEKPVTNARFSSDLLRVYITCTRHLSARELQLVKESFSDYDVSIDSCIANETCPTRDPYKRKVTPILKEYEYN